ncbi:MAG: hypothetical protein ACYC7F_05965 [Gemmatimonadaceae bacterium]
MHLRLALSALPLSFVLAAASNAQTSVTASISGSADSFRPIVGSAESRRAFAGALALDRYLSAGRGRLFYDLAFGSFDSPGDWTYQRHNAGVSRQLLGADSSSRKVFVQGALTLRRNGASWSGADYSAVGGGINFEATPRPLTTTRLGYRADYRRFSELGALSQFEQRAFASLIANFETRTTIIMEAALGAKSYAGVVEDGSLDTVTVAAGSGGRGFATGLSASGTSYTTVTYAGTRTENGSAGLGTAMFRVAQSLTDRTGLRLEASVRRTFGAVPPLLVVTPAGFIEDGIYDDPFASSAHFVEVGLTHAFANSAELAATGWWAQKAFTSAGALDVNGAPLAGDPLRRDRIAIGSVTWAQPLLSSRTGAYAVSADLAYRLLRHTSNDALYDYTSHAVSVGLSIRH